VFNREVLMYKAECLRADVRRALDFVADAVLRPALGAADLDGARRVIAFQRDEAASQPQVLVSEQLYAAAYGRGSPLGRPEKCPAGALAALDGAALRRFASAHFCAPRMVLSAVGV
jgi:predicted Zn-dependent peptidase